MWREIIFAVFASSGFWAIVQYLLQRYDGKQKQLDEICDKLNQLSERVETNAATSARTHILRFSDELSSGVNHSQEYFRQVMDDIDTYEQFCMEHPRFRNSYAVMATQHIRETYAELLKKQEFNINGGDKNAENEQ